MTLTILGTASGLPEANRAHAALALHDGNSIFLLDAGEGACSALLRAKLDPLKLKKIYITHTHPDHCVGLFMILQYLHMKKCRRWLDIYLPKDALPAFQPFMNQLYLVPDQINPQFRLRPLKNEHMLDNGWVLQSFPTNHLQHWKELAIPGLGTSAYAFRLKSGKKSLFYSGDIADFSDISTCVNQRDLLVLEGAHIEVESVIAWALEKGLKRLILTHILPWGEFLRPAQIRAAKKKGLTIALARDGLILNL
ncbi:MAG TPA: MBL fold metallo-hydrolase [bacterium]|jgi:ribonuclease BN (tRNA processing enzyme)